MVLILSSMCAWQKKSYNLFIYKMNNIDVDENRRVKVMNNKAWRIFFVLPH